MDRTPGTPRAILYAAAAIVAGIYLYALLMPPAIADAGPGLCLLKSATGVPCPLCGMSRAFIRASHGDLGGAFRSHGLFPLIYLGGLVLLASIVADLVGSTRFNTGSLVTPLRAVAGLVALFAVYWVLRLVLLAGDGSLSAAFYRSPVGRLLGG